MKQLKPSLLGVLLLVLVVSGCGQTAHVNPTEPEVATGKQIAAIPSNIDPEMQEQIKEVNAQVNAATVHAQAVHTVIYEVTMYRNLIPSTVKVTIGYNTDSGFKYVETTAPIWTKTVTLTTSTISAVFADLPSGYRMGYSVRIADNNQTSLVTRTGDSNLISTYRPVLAQPAGTLNVLYQAVRRAGLPEYALGIALLPNTFSHTITSTSWQTYTTTTTGNTATVTLGNVNGPATALTFGMYINNQRYSIGALETSGTYSEILLR